jgi:hypothetical protein
MTTNLTVVTLLGNPSVLASPFYSGAALPADIYISLTNKQQQATPLPASSSYMYNCII